MGAGPGRILVRFIWSPPDVLGVRGFSSTRPRWVRQPLTPMTKPELRRTIRAARKAFVAARGGNHFAPDHAVLHLSPLLNSKSIISIYQSSSDECSCYFLEQLRSMKFALPCANTKEDRLVFRQWSPKEPLEMSPLGFLQPLNSATKVTPTLIIAPLLGFDRALNRLGQGAGHYDRAFQDFPDAIRIGLAWSVQEVPSLTPDLWDVPLDAVLTEREWITKPPETNS
jgi:5-formyltetrahydrofolate cyclo-ligase